MLMFFSGQSRKPGVQNQRVGRERDVEKMKNGLDRSRIWGRGEGAAGRQECGVGGGEGFELSVKRHCGGEYGEHWGKPDGGYGGDSDKSFHVRGLAPERKFALAVNALILACVTLPAWGYTDPGSGLLVWQMLGAAVVGGLFYVKKFLERLRPGRKKDRE